MIRGDIIGYCCHLVGCHLVGNLWWALHRHVHLHALPVWEGAYIVHMCMFCTFYSAGYAI